MASRDDSTLYSGITSASLRDRTALREEKKRERESLRTKVSPAQEIITGVIEEEKLQALDLRGFVFNEVTPEADVKAELLAHKLNYEFIVRFQQRINLLLREPKQKVVKDE